MGFTKEERMKYIGSSDIAAVLGLSRWKTPLQVWAEKTGELDPPDLSNNEPAEWGKRLEEVVAKKFAEKNNVRLIAYKKRYIHKEYPFLSCELDRLVTGTEELVEVKTCTAYKAKEWQEEDDIPVDYVIQVMYALGLSGRKVGHIAVLIGGQRYKEKKVLFDQEMYNDMVKKAVDFWNIHVLMKVPPVAVGQDNEIMVELFPSNEKPELLQVSEEVNSMVALLQETKMHLVEMVNEKKDIEAKLKAIIGTATGIETERFICTWKEQLKKSYVVKESKTRVLRVSTKKGEK